MTTTPVDSEKSFTGIEPKNNTIQQDQQQAGYFSRAVSGVASGIYTVG